MIFSSMSCSKYDGMAVNAHNTCKEMFFVETTRADVVPIS